MVQSFGIPDKVRTYKINPPATEPNIYEYFFSAVYTDIEFEFYPESEPEKQASDSDKTFRFDIVNKNLTLDCGLKIGMTVKEVIDRYGNREVYNLEDTAEKMELMDIKHVLTSHKSANTYNGYQKAIIIYVDPDKFDKPIQAMALVLLIKDSKVDRIVFGYPTAD